MTEPQFVTIRDAAAISGLSLPTIRRRINSGELEAVIEENAFGKLWMIPRQALAGLSVKRPGRTSRRSPKIGDSIDHESDNLFDQATNNLSAVDQKDSAQSLGTGLCVTSSEQRRDRNLSHVANPEVALQKQQTAYWRGRWEESKESINHLRDSLEQRSSVDLVPLMAKLEADCALGQEISEQIEAKHVLLSASNSMLTEILELCSLQQIAIQELSIQVSQLHEEVRALCERCEQPTGQHQASSDARPSIRAVNASSGTHPSVRAVNATRPGTVSGSHSSQTSLPRPVGLHNLDD